MNSNPRNIDVDVIAPPDRRRFLSTAGLGLAGVALESLLQREARAVDARQPGPHFAPRAKSVVWLMMRGGVSHLESFDPKPELDKYDGKTIGETPHAEQVVNSKFFANVREQVANNVIKTDKARLWKTQVGFGKGGQSGLDVSDWWPHVRARADDLAVIRSMWTTDNNHGAQLQFMSGRHLLDGCFPTIGSWIHYGLGSLNDNLPQFVSMGPPLESQCFDGLGAHYLGPEHAGVQLTVNPNDPLPYGRAKNPPSADVQRIKQELLGQLNGLTAQRFADDEQLRARIKSFELAFRMQATIPEVMRLQDETDETQRLYGVDQAQTKAFGQQLLATRRMVEKGVRFIQLFHGGGAAGAWDAHTKLVNNHTGLCGRVDKPIAGFLEDMKRRGLLDETIVLWTTEFGRTPGKQGADGRDHHNYGFSIWMAGAGIRGGAVHGATDEIGFHAVEDRHYVTDIHATVFHLLGLDARRLSLPGRIRLERDYGDVIHGVLS
ncbi:MAG: DUF1501 domain-containing protein [Pirellulaceae bacterium]|jgi:hypothetical protein|nr:DUF1501 domain-containing protein [Pirellulaceae bacterium]MDP7014335.1 DUF1501 domain-containing protein [Pirellulaceae bacterium]